MTLRAAPRTPHALVKENGAWTGLVDVAIAQTLPSGRHAREADVTLPFSLTDEVRNRLLRDGLTVTRTIILQPEAHQVRVVARDVASGTTGSVIITASQIDKRERLKTLAQTGAK